MDLSSTIDQEKDADDVTTTWSVSFVTNGNNFETSSTSHGPKDDVTKEVTSPIVKTSSDSATSPLLGNDTTIGDSNATGKDNRPSGKELHYKPQYTQTEVIIIVVVTVVGGLLVIAVVVALIVKNRLRIMRLIRRKDEEVFVLTDRHQTPTQSSDAPRTNPSPSGQVVAEIASQPSKGSKGKVTEGGSSRLQERSTYANTGYMPCIDNESQKL